MIELSTPIEIIGQLTLVIEDERKIQKLQQKELALKAGVPLPTYKDFIYKQKISFESLLKLLIALRLFDNITGLLRKREIVSLSELKNENRLPKRIDK